ncbi:hypothetical protein PTD2_07904 [Pseudoalteromonas tunicata D2]|uniref:Uncharacterized protein n=1 Tax=Pseudoalteromonas tunicata D2 TaxID=87626 RepID=A4C8N6_9GAMM|nr:hypothetical protein PTD2_07904 [Pseudoalteromonas tunicata D2]
MAYVVILNQKPLMKQVKLFLLDFNGLILN